MKRIMCATDFSDAGQVAEAQAIALARAFGAELVYVHVNVETPLYGEAAFAMADVERVYEAQRRWAHDTLRARASAAEQSGVRTRFVLRSGVPHEQIVAACAEEGADMLVIGTHGRSGLNRFLMGSVAERVVRSASCPVLTVRTPEIEAREAA